MDLHTKSAKVDRLLSELCTTQGLCLAARDRSKFEALVASGIDALADSVLSVEGLDPQSHQRMRDQVRRTVEKHFLAWAAIDRA